MAGYTIELYKNIISDEKYWAEQSISNSALKNRIYVTFGEFDKMTVSRVNSFSRMRDVSEMSKDWIGDRQKIFLFDLADHNQLEYREAGDVCGFFSNRSTGSVLCTKLILGVTIFQFKEIQAETSNNIKQTLDLCRMRILDLVKNENLPVECSVLGILGTYGVAVIWAADQFTHILKIINRIKGTDVLSTKDLEQPDYKFISVFTFFAKNKDGYNEKKISELEGVALLQITLQTNLSQKIIDKIDDKIPGSPKFHIVGEYDLMLETPIRNLYTCFENGNIFDPSSDFYRYHILQTNVRLCKEVTKEYVEGIQEIKETTKLCEESKRKKENDKLMDHLPEIDQKYKNLREMFFDKFPKTAGMVDSLDLMYGDYHSKIACVSNKMWAMDFSQQFLAILSLLESSFKAATSSGEGSISAWKFLDDVQDILNCFEYQTIHISESNNLLLNTPQCHLRYTGQNNLVLYAYFGIIKDLIELAYRMQKESRQSKIIPLISVDTVPMISSLLFMDFGSPFEDRLIKINFPMMAMYSLPVYASYLHHEVFHYIAPRDRVVRNWAKGCILAFWAVKNIICELVNSASRGRKYGVEWNIIEGILNPRIYIAVINNYSDPLVDKVRSDINKNKYDRDMVNKESYVWLQYENHLIELLMKYVEYSEKTVLTSNLVYIVLSELYNDRKKIMDECKQEVGINDRTEMTVLLNNFMDSLVGLYSNTGPEKRQQVFHKLMKDTGLSNEQLIADDELVQISDALKEVVCDLPMIELSRLNALAYLTTYVKIQSDLLKWVDSQSQIQHYIRIGVALDYFFGWDISSPEKISKLEALQFEFMQSYVGLYFGEKKSYKVNGLNDYVKGIEDDAKRWFIEIQKWYRKYLSEYRIFGSLLKVIIEQSSIKDRIDEKSYKLFEKFKNLKTSEFYDSVRLYGMKIINSVRTAELSETQKRVEITRAKELFEKEVFTYNIDIILTYQKQINFEELGKICEKSFDGEAIYRYEDKLSEKIRRVKLISKIIEADKENAKIFYKYKAGSLLGLLQTIQKTAECLETDGKKQYGDKGSALWYRGHQDSSYILIPSAMRKYAQVAETGQSLRNYQVGVYGEFKFRMDDASEKIDKSGYTECDYLALMQHHGSPTIYMDWSENAITALYFALEAFIDPGKKGEQDNKDAVLYVMHPNLYNEARNRMMEMVCVKSGRNLDYIMKNSQLRSTRSLPNLSMQQHGATLGMFLLGNVCDEKDIYEMPPEKIESLSFRKDPENILYLPMAIYASRANERVQAQSGMFMAYNIFTKPSETKYFDYMSLEKIQDFYLSEVQGATPFLYSIVINGSIKKEIADWLKVIGVTKDMIYPELANIGERIG